MNAKTATLVIAGSLTAFALAAAPTSRKADMAHVEPTPYSADHARIQGDNAELPPQF